MIACLEQSNRTDVYFQAKLTAMVSSSNKDGRALNLLLKDTQESNTISTNTLRVTCSRENVGIASSRNFYTPFCNRTSF